MNRVVLIFCMFLGSFFSNVSQAQNRILLFEPDSIYLGRFHIEDTPIKHKIPFLVTSDSAITIESVKSDCACVVTNYPNESLKPKSKSFIEVAVMPYQSGFFAKSFAVKVKGIKDEFVVKVSAYMEVFTPNPELEFEKNVGNLRFKNKTVQLGTIDNQHLIRKEIEVYNPNDYAISFLDSIEGPEYIEVVFMPDKEKIAAKDRGSFLLFYDPSLKNDFGYLIDNVVLFTDDSLHSKIDLNVAASIKQASSYSDLEDAPKLNVNKEVVDLGRIYLKDKSLVSFTLFNSGKSDLVINKIITNPGVEVLSVQTYLIPSFKSSVVNVKVTDIGKKGKQERTLIIFSNDADQATKTLTIKANLR